MDKQIHDSLYNKTIKDITKEDLGLYTQLLNCNSAFNSLWPCFFIAISIFIPVWIIYPVPPLLIFALNAIPALFAGAMNGAINFRCWEQIGELGISKQEFKEFKKSGGLKRIKKIVKEYKKNPYYASNIHQLPNGLKIEDFEKQEQATKTQTKEQKKAKILSQQKLNSSNGLDKTDENQEDWTIQH